MQSPHDLLFHHVFADLENARSHLGEVLPQRVVSALDLTRLEAAPTRMVDAVLSGRTKDLLFRVPLRGDGSEAFIFVLLEHQSSVDRRMAWRLLRYMVRAWDFWVKDAAPTTRFPPIIPLVLYHGERRWTARLDFAELLAVPSSLRDESLLNQPSLRYSVQDLSQLSEEELRGRAMVQMALLLMRRAHTGDLLSQLERWADVMKQVLTSSGVDGLGALLTYMMEVEQEPRTPQEWRSAIETALKDHPETREHIMGLANWLRQQGREEGIQIGEQRGRQEGLQEGVQIGMQRERQALLVRFLRQRFGSVSDGENARIAQANTEQVQGWIDRLFTANSVAEVLGEPSAEEPAG